MSDATPPIKIRGMDDACCIQLWQRWEECFPGRGLDILEVFGTFYADPNFRVLPPADDLEQRVARALFWSAPVGMCLVQPKSLWLSEYTYTLSDRCFATSDWRRLYPRAYEAIDAEAAISYRGSHPGARKTLESLWTRVFYGLSSSIGCNIRGLSERTWERIYETPISYEGQADVVWFMVWQSLQWTLFHAVAHVVSGSRAFTPLLDLWLSGNLPTGFTADNRLVILCSPESEYDSVYDYYGGDSLR